MKKRIVSVLLFISMMLMSMPSVGALEIMSTPILLIDIGLGSVTIENGTAENTFKLIHGAVQTDNIDRFTIFKISGTSTNNNITVSANSYRPHIMLGGVNIDSTCAFRITESAGQVLITLEEGSTNILKSSYYFAGLQKENCISRFEVTHPNHGNDVLLTIKGPGTLHAIGGTSNAGIGGVEGGDFKHINIHSGNIFATGGQFGAGIGGGGGVTNSGSYITIQGGNVTANGGVQAAGIGGGGGSYGNNGFGSNITITGGTVTANGGGGFSGPAGIGGGCNQYGSNITISGGTVTANGSDYGAGIGGGCNQYGSNITISGGTVTANGGDYGAGIGGGMLGFGSNITIDGGNVTASGGESGAGIGGGFTQHGSNITISDGNVTANGGESGAGIGGGMDGLGSNITISDGYVIANAGNLGGAGIGGGFEGSGSNITITGGTITATGDYYYSTGIGGGRFSSSSDIIISGGNIKASSIGTVPTAADGVTPVYKATFAVPGTGISTGTAVSGLGIPGYNTNSIVTLDNNKVYTYLPKNTSNTRTTATYGGRLYAAQVNTAGTAAFTLVPPIISEISSPDTVTTGNPLSVTVPTINANGFTIASQGWQLQKSGGSYERFYPYATALDMTYNNSSLRYFAAYTDEDSTEKTVYSNEVIISVAKVDGSVSIISDISKIYDGTAVSEPVYDKLGTGTVTVEYKIKGADDSTYTITKPVSAGEYTLRVSAAEDNIYNAASDTADFTISFLATPASPYTLSPVANASGWHNTDVTITPASGYTISGSLNGTYLPSITVSESKAGYAIYLKNAAGQMTDGITVDEIKIDKEAPTNVTISYEKDGWREFLNTVTFGLFFKDTIQVKLSATDAVSGVKEFKYTLDGTEYIVTAASGSAKFSIVPQYKGNISAIKAIDNAGNESDEIVTEYFAVDSTSPAAPTVDLNGYISETWTNSDVRFTISGAVALSGIAKYQYSTDNGATWNDMVVNDETAATDNEPYNAIAAELTVSTESDGISYIFRAVSNAGNNGAESSAVVAIDKAVPTINISGDIESYKQNDTVTITASAGISGISRVAVKKDDGSYNDITSSYSSGYTVTENGTYTFRITNGANLTAIKSITYTKLDSAKPVVSIDSNDYIQDTWTNGDVTLTVSNTASNLGTTTFQYSTDNANWNSYTGAITIGSDTNTTYYFKAISAAGVESNVESIVVKLDKTAPTGEITVKAKGFTSFLNTITFGLFFKNTIGISVSGADSDSTVDTVEYYLSETALDNTTDWTSIGWTVGNSTSVTANWKGVVYAKITDKAGNVSIINSDGIVVYTDSGASVSASFVKNSTFDLSVPVEMNSNTVKSVSYGGTALILGTDYNVDTNAIIFKNAYLKSLLDGDAVFTVEWNPFGEEYVAGNDNDVPGTTTITISISRAEQLDTLTITGLADSYTYGDSTINLSTEGGSGDGAVSFISNNPDVASVSGTTVTIHKAGSFTITATKAQDDVYNAKSVISDTVTVEQADPDISLDGTNVDYGNYITLTVTVSGAGAVPTGTITFKEDSTILATVNLVNGTATYTTSTLPIAGYHSYSVEYSGQIGYYNSGTASKTVGVGKIDQTGFDFNAPPTLTYGDTGKSLSASGGQTESTPVFSVQPNNYIDIAANGAITIKGAGSVKVTAKKTGDNNYNEAVAELIVTVVPRDINLVSVNVSGSKVYTGSRLLPSFDVSDGSITITNGDYTNAYGANITVAQGGTITLTGQKNYTGTKTVSFDILKAIPANVVFPTPAAVDYDPAKTLGDIALSGTGDGVFTWENENLVPTVGNSGYIVKFTPNDADNFDYSGITLEATVQLTVNKVDPAYTLPTPTATYGDTLESVSLPNGWTWDATGIVGDAGTQKHKATFKPEDTVNYNTLTDIEVEIAVAKKAITVTADDKEKFFGNADPQFSYTVDPELLTGDTLTGSLKYEGEAVGTYDIVEDTPFSNDNYIITFASGTMTIKHTPTMEEIIAIIEDIPDPDDIEDDDKGYPDKIADITDEYEDLTDEEKEQIPNDMKDKLKEAQDKAGKINHTDGDITVTGDNLPWYVRVAVTPILETDARYSSFFEKLSEKKLLALYDIKLINTLTDEDYELTVGQSVTVEIAGTSLDDKDEIAVAHQKKDGTIEYLTATVSRNKVIFKVSDFSLYGVTTKAQAADKAPQTDDNSNPFMWILIVGAALTVLGGTLITGRKRKSEKEKYILYKESAYELGAVDRLLQNK